MIGIFLDTETNGLNAHKHFILEIAFKLIDLRTGAFIDEYQTLISHTEQEWRQSDKESLAVNGFCLEDIKNGKTTEEAARDIKDLFKKHKIKRGNAVFICQNPSFDRAFFCQLIDPDTQEALAWPYHWLDLASMYWAVSLQKGKKEEKYYPWNTGVSKDKIAAVYHLAPESKPHRARNGVDHLLACYTAVLGFPDQ